ncbi:MAG: sugar nucleotide-binding protein, partial [Cytophagales bacterium]|nr:sugar nucleotide-binding protein [Cytophagales bacterium]
RADWSWADERLGRLRELGIAPIVGFVHHGSGPRHTSLVDPAFPDKLAGYAAAFAARYPWVEDFTPVNEPLTTARFSGLYGHWYPHGKDNRTFAKALLIQCKAVVKAMEAIRVHIPRARLVQTEDFCKVSSTPMLAYQARYENERRWLSWDLLCGRVDESHRLWRMLRNCGVSKSELRWFRANPCPPDVLGVNHYLTSNRYLDERWEQYPAHYHGGNRTHRYADVEAVRVPQAAPVTLHDLLKEVWHRYQLPIAITEAHLCATREEQLRWLQEFWNTALRLRGEHVEVIAVTAWSLLGSFDWNSLVTRNNGFYESGVFDLRSARPRPTALAGLLSHLASQKPFRHPVLEIPGFWHRSRGPAGDAPGSPGPFAGEAAALPAGPGDAPARGYDTVPPVLILGATGTLGSTFGRLCGLRGIPYRTIARKDLDVTDPDAIRRAIRHYKPWAVINAAGYAKVDGAERNPDLCFRLNTHGPAVLAQACREHDVQLITFSSALVFDGNTRTPYLESDKVYPLNVYGNSKAKAERRVLEIFPETLIIRTSTFFGPWDQTNFMSTALRTIAQGRPILVPDNLYVSPAYLPDLVNTCLDLLIDHESGVWHLTNGGATSWWNLTRQAAQTLNLDAAMIQGCPLEKLPYVALRPKFSALSSERGLLLPPLEDALARYCRESAFLPSAANV